MHGLSLVAASGGHSSSRCAGLSLSRPLFLWSTGSRRAGSVIVAHGPSCSAACGIFPDQGSNPWALHWQADSQPLRHQGSPVCFLNSCKSAEKLQELSQPFHPDVSIVNILLHFLHHPLSATSSRTTLLPWTPIGWPAHPGSARTVPALKVKVLQPSDPGCLRDKP